MQSEFATQQDQTLTSKATKTNVWMCGCQIFACVQEPTSLFIKVPKSRVLNCLAMFAHSLELIACSFHNLTSKALASFNTQAKILV